MSGPARSVRPRWWVFVLVGLGVAALAFAIGRFSTFSAGAQGPNAADAGFARDMQLHHAQAIDMAMVLYRETDDPQLRSMAYDIATSQGGQRGEMYDWLVQWGLPQSGVPMTWMTASGDEHGGHGAPSTPMTDDEMRAAMGMASDAELDELRAAEGAAADCLFLELMIRHHEGALPMVDAVLELGSMPRVLAVAGSIKQAQTAEVEAMKAAQLRLGCTTG